MKQDRQIESWAEQMGAAPFAEEHFTNEMKNRVLDKANVLTTKGKSRRARTLVIASLAIATALIIGLTGLLERLSLNGDSRNGTSSVKEERLSYYEDGELKLSVFPDPELAAGRLSGYIFHMTAPFEEIKGRMLAIRAEHLDTGQQEVAVAPEEILKPSSGYPGLERYTATITLPLSGMWRYVVELDGEPYGDVILNVPEPSWEVSPEFKSGAYWLRGIEGNVGFIDAGFLAGSPQKYMWHFWQERIKLEGAFTVRAVKQGERQMIDIFSRDDLGGPINGADHNAVSTMTLPEPGKWMLLPYVGDRLLGSIVVEAK
ncbi:DUF4871 domain-containing protein [Paenibacillus spongiae]|uniref:DUF4871 domain-containing protein n=1 Tax=Paenibacillus spongiae TaxID=2909671 RepID=A0ABY5SFG9_9BACL|nr:DUF4871 domain-containing protein [Paenibacillus spongiae]UVI32721.1 DUF4871 domain-containing protein [Paenibacillus spongiae]